MKEVKINKEEVFILSFLVDEELMGRVQLEKADISLIRDACNKFLGEEAKSEVDKPTDESTSCDFDSSQIIKGGLPRPNKNIVVGIPEELRPAFRPEPYEEPKKKVKYVCRECGIDNYCTLKLKEVYFRPKFCCFGRYGKSNWIKEVK